MLVVLKRTGVCCEGAIEGLLGAGVLGDGLGSLRDSMLGQFSRQQKPDRGLDFTGCDGGPLVVVSKTASLSSNALKKVIDKGVHDGHGLGGDTGHTIFISEGQYFGTAQALTPAGIASSSLETLR